MAGYPGSSTSAYVRSTSLAPLPDAVALAADQPAWARPALLAIAAVAAVAYGWGMAGASIEPFYGAAARSMSESWHDFIFGAFDPAGTVTVDKAAPATVPT